MSIMKDLITMSVKNRNSQTLNQALTIVFNDRMNDKEFIIHEYDGDVPRLFGDESHIELMLPNVMDTVMENAVVDAINSGSIFDDAENVNNTAKYISMTKYPTCAMVNRGMDEPKRITYTIGTVVGGMDSDGHFGRDENDVENGVNYAHDIIAHGNADNVHDLVASYINAKDTNKLPIMFKKHTRGIDHEIEDIKSIKHDDIVTDEDIDRGTFHEATPDEMDDDIQTKKECGTVCDIDEEYDESQRSPETGILPTEYQNEEDDYVGTGEMQSGESWDTPTSTTYDESYVEEGFFRRPKKLKPIPRDVVAYITVEINAIKDANDQAMLAGYTCSKLELVDFYITCIDTQDDRYIVPHTRQYLIQMQNDLNRLLTRILQIRPINKNDRMWKVILPD